MKQQFFGDNQRPLFGVYHAPRGRTRRSRRGVLICPPIGQEYNRTHWTLRLMANQLARKGIHVMRMDYSGIGDSAGAVMDITSLATWQDDIQLGIERLKTESGVDTVMLVGQRMGAALAAKVAMQRPDVNALVSWETVVDGQAWLDELRTMHARMLDLWVCKMATDDSDTHEEILGSLYRRELIDEIKNLRLNLAEVIQPQLIVEQKSLARDLGRLDDGLQKIIYDSRPGTWGDLLNLETAFLRPQVMREMVRLIEFTFDRLDHFNALEIAAPTTPIASVSIPPTNEVPA